MERLCDAYHTYRNNAKAHIRKELQYAGVEEGAIKDAEALFDKGKMTEKEIIDIYLPKNKQHAKTN